MEGIGTQLNAPLMGKKAAAKYIAFVVVTSDNPRGEDPQVIIDQAKRDIHKDYRDILDRKEAICFALTQSPPEARYFNYREGA